MANVKAETLVDALADTLLGVKAETLIEKVDEMNTNTLFDSQADKLAEVEA